MPSILRSSVQEPTPSAMASAPLSGRRKSNSTFRIERPAEGWRVAKSGSSILDISPGPTSKETSASAGMPAKRFWIPCISSTGSAMTMAPKRAWARQKEPPRHDGGEDAIKFYYVSMCQLGRTRHWLRHRTGRCS